MKNKFMSKVLFALSLVAMVGFSACYDDDDDEVAPSSSTTNNRPSNGGSSTNSADYTVHKFVWSTFGTYYYWDDNVPSRMDFSQYDEPIDVLESFRADDDRFSTVVNNYTELSNELDGISTTDGLIYDLYYADATSNNIIALVSYVYPDSPADEAGMERGDVISKVNGTTMTDENYSDLMDAATCSYTYQKIYSTVENGKTYLDWDGDYYISDAITKIEMDADPVLQVKTFDSNGTKVGYMLYESFTSDTKTIMDAIEKLESQQVTELILDLRLNGGGYVSTLDTLAAMLVPDGHEGDVFIQEDYNSTLNSYFEMYYGSDFNKEFFVEISPKLNLTNLYVLTSYGTASASEEIISGLTPYMNVIKIGEATYGKFTSNLLLNDDVDWGYDADGTAYSEWACYVSAAVCKNSAGEMNFADGFTPDYDVTDTYVELGTEDDPLIAKALELISGSVSKKSVSNAIMPAKHFKSMRQADIIKNSLIKQL